MCNLTFTGCKPAIRSYGEVVAYNVTFVDNQRFDTLNSHGLMREGGAIDNFADLTCANCTFKNNKGSYGGAVCGEDGSVNKFLDCKWGGNTGTGEDLYMSNGASAYVFLNHVNQVPLFECSDTGLVRVLNTKNNNSNFTKVINVRNSEELSKVLVQLTAASKYNYADVVINLTGNKEYTLSPEDYGGLWKRIVNHVNDLDSFLDIGGMLGGLKDWGVSLFTNTKKDEADKFVDAHFCKIKGGMNVHLVGNGAIIMCNGDKNANYHLFYVTSSGVLTLDNVTVKGFNSAIINHGRVLANNTDFVGNEIRYFFAEDDNGGAVRNFGSCDFVNCNFKDNLANKGGAIYNNAGNVNLIDCSFKGNKALFCWKPSDTRTFVEEIPLIGTIWNWGKKAVSATTHAFTSWKENDVYNINTGLTKSVGKSGFSSRCDDGGISVIRKDNNPIVKNITVGSKDDMLKAIKLVNNNNGEFDIANVTVRSKGALFNLGKDDSFNVKYGLLILNGNGCSFKTDMDIHLLESSKISTVILDNFTVSGFKTPVVNKGVFKAYNSVFTGNHVDYAVSHDYTGVIDNSGMCDFVNCTFGDNSAKYGGVIYNEGSANFIDCIFNNNRGYNKEGRAIYDSKLGRSNIIYSDNSTAFNGTYFLDNGISQIKNCVLSYTANWMSVATMIAGIFFAPLEGVSAVISGAVSVGAASAASTWINSYKAVCNHDVHVGNLVWSSVNTAIGHLMMYGLGKTIGKKLFKQNKGDVKAPKEKYAKRDVRIKEADPYEDIGEKNPNENPQTSSKIRTILDEERENPVSESKNPVSKNKNPKPVKISLSDSDMELGNNIIMKGEQIKWENPTGVVDKLMPNYNLASIKNYVGQYNDLIRGGCKNPARLVNVVKNINICFNNIKSVLSSRGISVSHVSNFMSFSAVDSIFEPLCVYLDNMMNSINIEFCRIGYYPYG